MTAAIERARWGRGVAGLPTSRRTSAARGRRRHADVRTDAVEAGVSGELRASARGRAEALLARRAPCAAPFSRGEHRREQVALSVCHRPNGLPLGHGELVQKLAAADLTPAVLAQ